MDLFERPGGGERAVLVHLTLRSEFAGGDLEEFRLLVSSAGATAVAEITGKRDRPDSRLFVGTGKLEDIRNAITEHEADVVLFDHALSPAQERNLERELQCRVLDRTGVILDIFAQRARTFEGKLQVELAQLEHLSTRLVRGWTHLERQKGGIGLRGPGESQLETDRRLIKLRIAMLSERLDKVRRQRTQSRRARERNEVPTLALVGYTNAGKSSLFNRLCDTEIYAADQLFATLDPTLRRIDLDGIGSVVLADTVGFIRHLPHKLVESFRATLEEVVEADLLLHVVDANASDVDANIAAVMEVLQEVGADKVPMLEIRNKIDLLDHTDAHIDGDEFGTPSCVWISAQQRQGLDLLISAISERLGNDIVRQTLDLPPGDGKLRAYLYAQHAVLDEQINDDGHYLLHIQMQRKDWNRMMARR